MKLTKTALWTSAGLIGLAFLVVKPAAADQVFLDDIIVDGSACIGLDCVNGESFGFDTLRLKENNLRIKAQDTSSTASFPTNDWQITFNDSSNGGANKFAIDDIDGSKTPFTIEANAPSHSLFVDDVSTALIRRLFSLIRMVSKPKLSPLTQSMPMQAEPSTIRSSRIT